MPSMADITVKKNDGTTDVTYTAISAASGDKSPLFGAATRSVRRLDSVPNSDWRPPAMVIRLLVG